MWKPWTYCGTCQRRCIHWAEDPGGDICHRCWRCAICGRSNREGARVQIRLLTYVCEGCLAEIETHMIRTAKKRAKDWAEVTRRRRAFEHAAEKMMEEQ